MVCPQMAQGEFEKVAYEVADGVATVTLNDPEKRNMLSGQMLAELVEAMKIAKASDEVRAVVLTGAGEKVFCAGADLGGFAADAPLVAKHFASDLFFGFFRLMPRLGKPSLCAANGPGLAGGGGGGAFFGFLVAQGGGRLWAARDQLRAVPLQIL